jgi:TonB family protein
MFESVAPDVFGRQRSRFALYESLPLSIAVHLVMIGIAATSFEWNVLFPNDPPRLVLSYSIVESLEPPPPPPPPAAPKPSAPDPPPAEKPVLQQFAPAAITAPTVIPDAVRIVEDTRPVPIEPAAAVPHGPDAPSADAGVAGGIAGGEGGAGKGVVHGVAGGIMGDDGRVHFARNSQLPMFQVRQAYPEYPEQERHLGFEDDVVVRYIIGKDGHVKELVVLEHPQYKAFEKSTLKAIQLWQFRPLVVDGETREVVHELLVRFRLER